MKVAGGGFGWSGCQNPSCIHMCFTLLHVPHKDAIIASMRAAAAEMMATSQPGDAAEAKAGIYGVTDASGDSGSGRDMSAVLRRYMGRVLDMPKPRKAKKKATAAPASRL